MGKGTRRLAVCTMLGVFAGICARTAAAQAPSIDVGSTTGAAGQTVSFSVSLSLNGSGALVAGTQNNIAFDASTPIGALAGSYCALTSATTCTTSADCPVYPVPFDHEACIDGFCSLTTGQSCTLSSDCPEQHEACVPSPTGTPDCAVNPALGKSGFFAFTPNGCSGATCTGVSAIIVAVNDLAPIADNTELYSCNVKIDQGAAMGDYPLTVSGVVLGDTSGLPIDGATGNNGAVTVGAGVAILVCDVIPSTGNDAGQFGDGTIANADVVALFRASLNSSQGPPPPAGTARFVAMDSAPTDTPPTCGGDGNIVNSDVVTCFRQSLGAAATYVRTVSGTSCTSAQQ